MVGAWQLGPQLFSLGLDFASHKRGRFYLLTDREGRLAGIAILAGRLESLPSANFTAVALGRGIGTSATG